MAGPHGTVDGGIPALQRGDAAPPRPFRPPPYLYGYAFHVAQALVEGRRIPSQRTLAPMLGISHKTLSAALMRPGAQAWLTEELRRHLGAEADVTARILARVAGLALQGNLEAARVYFQAVGRVGEGPAFAHLGGAVQNNITLLIPAPASELEGLTIKRMPDAEPVPSLRLPPAPPR